MSELSEEELWGELDDADGQRRGEILLELADRCYHRNDMAQFQALVEAAAEASESAGDDRLAAYARFNQGQGLMELERLNEAAEHFLQAAGFFQLLGEQADVALCHQRAGDAFGTLGYGDLALSHWRTALTLFAAEDDPLSEGRCHMAMGNFLIADNWVDPPAAPEAHGEDPATDEATPAAASAEAVAEAGREETAGDGDTVGQTSPEDYVTQLVFPLPPSGLRPGTHVIEGVITQDGDIEPMAVELASAQASDDQASDDQTAPRQAATPDHREAAEECFHAAREAFRRARSAQHVAWADDAAAESLMQRGRVAEALPLLRACLDIARVATDDLGRGYGGLRLGVALRLNGEYIESLTHLRDARGAYSDDDNLMGIARCDLEAAQCLRALGEPAEAETLFGQARSIFDAVGAEEYLVLADRARAELCLASGRPAEAAGIARQSLARASQTGQQTLALDHAALLAEALLELGDADAALDVVHEHLVGSDPAEPLDAARHQRVVARTLLAQGMTSEALDVVAEALAIDEVRTDPALHAELYELRWRCGSGPAADRDLAHAIALFLAADDADRAAALSRHFLPAEAPAAVRAADLLPMQSLRPPLVDDSRATNYDGA